MKENPPENGKSVILVRDFTFRERNLNLRKKIGILYRRLLLFKDN